MANSLPEDEPAGSAAHSDPATTTTERGGPAASNPRFAPVAPVPPNALRPWYFREWFLVPTFVWWPCSAILFIRSPWHNGVVTGALSWAWIIIGGGWIFFRVQERRVNGESLVDPTLLALAAPGILLTIVTQFLWLGKDRPRIRRIRDAGRFADYADPADDGWQPRRPPGDQRRRRRANRGSARSRRRRR